MYVVTMFFSFILLSLETSRMAFCVLLSMHWHVGFPHYHPLVLFLFEYHVSWIPHLHSFLVYDLILVESGRRISETAYEQFNAVQFPDPLHKTRFYFFPLFDGFHIFSLSLAFWNSQWSALVSRGLLIWKFMFSSAETFSWVTLVKNVLPLIHLSLWVSY